LHSQVSGQPGDLKGLDTSLKALVQKVQPGVVQILVTGYAASPGMVTSADALLSLEHSSGSGVVLSADGYIVTNAHVVDGARRIRVMLPVSERGDKRSILKTRGRILGAQLVNLDRETDLAVLKVNETGLFSLELAD
jgi:serine protease Do